MSSTSFLRNATRALKMVVASITFIAASLIHIPVALSAPEMRSEKLELPTATSDLGEYVKLRFDTSHIGFQWDGDANANIEVQWKTDLGWTSWSTIQLDDDAEGQTTTGGHRSEVIPVEATTELNVRADKSAGDIELLAVDTIHGPTHYVDNVSLSTPASAAQNAPNIVTRSGWGADESIRKNQPSFAPVSRFIVHHTDTPLNDPNPEATIRSIYAFHVLSNGWDDIGYNYLIDQSGQIYEGRYSRDYSGGQVATADDLNGNGVIGAHTLDHNVGSIGIALIGTYTTTTPNNAMLSSLEKLIAWQGARHHVAINNSSVFGHRDFNQTTCPGDAAYAKLAEIRTVAAELEGPISVSPVGYWIASHTGAVAGFGQVETAGDMSGTRLNSPIESMTATKDGLGYWLLGGDGGIFSFGDAKFYGSTGGMRLNKPIVGMTSTPSGNGYWLVASDGGIFSFGDARFYGSTGSMNLNKPVVGMASTPSGNGYWLVASDGGIFSFGDAAFYGSTGSLTLNKPIIGMAHNGLGNGYWLVAADGGVFAFNVPFLGSLPGLNIANSQAAGMEPSTTGNGYYILGSDGGVFTFGDATFYGSTPGIDAAALTMADPV